MISAKLLKCLRLHRDMIIDNRKAKTGGLAYTYIMLLIALSVCKRSACERFNNAPYTIFNMNFNDFTGRFTFRLRSLTLVDSNENQLTPVESYLFYLFTVPTDLYTYTPIQL